MTRRATDGLPARPWQLGVLDGSTLTDPDGRVVEWPGRPAVLLLSRLALPPQRVWTREELAELLWPGVEAARSRNRLRQLLSVLRQATHRAGDPDLLEADRVGVRLRPGALACDAADAGAPGELLPGFVAEWVLDERRARERPAAREAEARPRAALPHPLTRWRGEPEVLTRLCGLVRRERIVTVTGPGGSGKTRVALEAAHALAADFDRSVWVPLAACQSAADVMDQCLASLGLAGGGDALAGLGAALGGRRVLLLLDNLEQLAPAAVAAIAGLAARVASLHLLLTSRRAWEIDGEQVFVLPPLGHPAPRLPLDALARHPAMALLLDRIRAVRPDFRLDAAVAEPLAGLLQRLDGLPLAIELAATRLRSAEPAALLQSLQREDDSAWAWLERNGPRNAHDPREASMLQTLRWSWSCLSPASRRLLDAVSVFEGPFDAAAAAFVFEAPAELALDELVAHSLLRFEPGPLALYHGHPLTRQAVHHALDDAQRLRGRTRLRAWAAAWAGALPSSPPLAAVRQALPHLASAMRSAETDGEPAAALALFDSLQRALSDISLPSEVRASLLRCAGLLPDADARAVALASLARAALRAGDGAQARTAADAAMALLPPAGLPRATVLARVAHIRWRLLRDPAVAEGLDEALALAVAAGDLALQGSILSVQGAMSRPLDPAGAVSLQRRAIAAWSAAGDAHGVHTGRYNLALALGMQPATRREALHEIALVIDATRAAQDWGQLAVAYNQRGEVLRSLRRWDEAVAAYRECLRIADDAFERLPLAYGLWNLPMALVRRRDAASAVTAAALMAFAAGFWASQLGPLAAADRRDLQKVRRMAALVAGEARTAAAWAGGAERTLVEAVRLALDAR